MNWTVQEVIQEAGKRINERDPDGLEHAIRKAMASPNSKGAMTTDRRIWNAQIQGELARWLNILESERPDTGEEEDPDLEDEATEDLDEDAEGSELEDKDPDAPVLDVEHP